MPTEPMTVDYELRYAVALDNYEPCPRRIAYGTLQHWPKVEGDGRSETFTFDAREMSDNPKLGTVNGESQYTDAIYLIDDGRTVEPWYVAAYGTERSDKPTQVILHRFPTNYDASGNPVMRADRDEQVNYSMWQLGPRRAYHLKVTRK